MAEIIQYNWGKEKWDRSDGPDDGRWYRFKPTIGYGWKYWDLQGELATTKTVVISIDKKSGVVVTEDAILIRG